MTTLAMKWPNGWMGAAAKIGVPVEEYAAHRAAGRRWCCVCRSWLAAERFTVDRSRSQGIAIRCRPCHSKWVAARARATPMVVVAPPISGQTRCASCPRSAPFVLADGAAACARCLKAKVKERKRR